MSANKTQRFLCIWKIKKFNSISSLKQKKIQSPLFLVKTFCHSKWVLVLRLDYQKDVVCQIVNKSFDIPADIHVSFKFYLLCPNGNIIKTSKLFTELFYNNSRSFNYELITVDTLKQEMSNWPDDTVTLGCIMESELDFDSLLLTTSKTNFSGCKFETNVCEYDSSFMWSLKQSDSCRDGVLTIKEIKLGDFVLKVIITLKIGVCKFYLVSDVNDKRHHTLFCSVFLMKENKIKKVKASDFYQFSDQNNINYVDTKISMNTLQNFNLRFDLSYVSHSIMNYSHTNAKYDIETQSVFLELFKMGRTPEEEGGLQQRCKKLQLDEIFTDVELRVHDEIMTAHKNVLAYYRSPVLDQPMTKNTAGIVDIKAQTYSSFLEYTYTGSVEKMDEEMALSLLVVANKYNVPSLAKKCSMFLMSVLSNSNLCKVLLIADMVNQKELKASVVKLILKDSTNVLSSPDWLLLAKKNFSLATELLLLMSKKIGIENKVSKHLSSKKALSPCSSKPTINLGDKAQCTSCGSHRECENTPGSASTAKPSITTFENNLPIPAVPIQFRNQPTSATSSQAVGLEGAASNTFTLGNKPEIVNYLQPASSSTQMPAPALGSALIPSVFQNTPSPALGNEAPWGFNFGLPTSSNSTPVFHF